MLLQNTCGCGVDDRCQVSGVAVVRVTAAASYSPMAARLPLTGASLLERELKSCGARKAPTRPSTAQVTMIHHRHRRT